MQKKDSLTLTKTDLEQIKELLTEMNNPNEENVPEEKNQYNIEVDCPKTTLTVGEKIDIKITSQPAGLDLSAVEYEISPEGVIETSRTENGFRLVAKKKGTTTLMISTSKFYQEIPFTVKAKSNNNGSSSDSGSGSSSSSDSSDSGFSEESEDDGTRD